MAFESPYGTWKSSITAEQMSAKGIDFSFPRFFETKLYWMEFRPSESARTAIVQHTETGENQTLTPAALSVQTRAHEYGGCCYTVGGGHLFFVNATDQRIYCQNLNRPEICRPLSPDFQGKEQEYRFADLIYDEFRNRIIAVAEVHFADGSEPEAGLISVSAEDGQLETLIKGADFYSNPRISPNGEQVLWMEWNHPNMPWDHTRLLQAELSPQGKLDEPTLLSKNGESVFQPEWSQDGEIYCVSDRNQWWNLYRLDQAEFKAIFPSETECGLPQWQFGMSTWGFIDRSRILVAHCLGGEWELSMVDTASGEATLMTSPALENYNHFNHLTTNHPASTVAVIASGPSVKNRLLLIKDGDIQIVASSGDMGFTNDDISHPTAIRFPTTDEDEAFGYFYRPTNSQYKAPANELPPLVVLCHGGPTASTTASFNLKVQFWTSRGFAVVDVNYRGSTGYGRHYRDKLKGNWGHYDIDDACAAAEYVVKCGWADPDRLIIRGSSAGGYTVLGALCFRDLFSAGCSLYGIGDLNALASDTHKFEARYTDSLVAPPDQTEVYNERSPICHIEQFDCPTIFFQGLKDKVVPPEQAEAMVNALNEKNIPVAFVTYPNEAHGFRQTENVIHAFNAELAFYGEVFGFKTDSTVGDLEIRNLNIRNPEKP